MIISIQSLFNIEQIDGAHKNSIQFIYGDIQFKLSDKDKTDEFILRWRIKSIRPHVSVTLLAFMLEYPHAISFARMHLKSNLWNRNFALRKKKHKNTTIQLEKCTLSLG